jgi:cell wall-associated NlpC family hydrolase
MQMMRRLSTLAVLTGLLLAAPAQGAIRGLGTWDPVAQKIVRQAGVLPSLSPGVFGGEQRLSGTQLRDALAVLAARQGTAPVAAPAGRVSVSHFDAILVGQLGLGDVADAVQAEAWRAGLQPPPRFGTEVVARQLGLRFNHDSAHDAQELFPSEAITRAEAAWSLATVLGFDGSEAAYAREVLGQFHLPGYTPAQRRALRIAVSKIGMPYIWGGETDGAGSWFGWQAHGGYDCSGFVWRIFKLGRLTGGAVIHGRTAAAMAGEIPRSARIRLADAQPGDLLFFGPGRFWQRATEARITHVGIAMGSGFMIQSSSQGVYVAPLWEDWRVSRFSWARRVL